MLDFHYWFSFLSDYFISGVRKKVEDLCGCNDELIRPLNELSDLGPRANRTSTQGIEPSHQNSKHRENARNIFNQETEQVSKNEFKQNKSHSVWWNSENIVENYTLYDVQFLSLLGVLYISMRKRYILITIVHWNLLRIIWWSLFWIR